MRREFFKGDPNTFGDKTKSDKFGKLDLLHLPLTCSSDASSGKERRQKLRSNTLTIGTDNYRPPKAVQEPRAARYSPSGDSVDFRNRQDRNFRKSFCAGCHGVNGKGEAQSVICLFKSCNRNLSRESWDVHGSKFESDDFLIPRYRKNNLYARQRRLSAVESQDQRPKYNLRGQRESGVFPFRASSSGNLKVNSEQVVYETNKFSVLVADPVNTKVNVTDRRADNMNKEFDFQKNSAMNAIMKQGLGTSLGSLLVGRFVDAPVRKEKESSEYEGRATHEILDPELNLNRLGYTSNDTVNWKAVSLPEKKNLYLELYARITNFTNADCKVYIDNEEFNCHLLVLQCYSEVFHTYVAVKKVELPSDKCSPASFAFIYEWMITGDPSYRELSRENVLDIFNAAKYLKIKDLVEQCWAFIDNPDVFSEDTAFLLYINAKEKNLPEVRELMLPRIEKFFLMLVSSQDWLELDLEDVKNFLQSNYICVNCEMEVFMSAVRWLKHHSENRDQYQSTVLSCVRFGNLAPWQLVDIKRNPDNPEFRALAEDSAICKMIDDGLAFVIIKYWYGQENDDYQHWNSILALKEPSARNWSGTEKTYFTYREFLIYLDQYRRTQIIEKTKGKENKGCKELSPKPSKERSNVNSLPTLDEFLNAKKNTIKAINYLNCKRVHHPKMSRRQAVAIIERAYMVYRMRKKLVGLSKRLSKYTRRIENPRLARRMFELSSRQSSVTMQSEKRQLARNPWARHEPTVMRVSIPKQIEVKSKDRRGNKLELQSKQISQSIINNRQKQYLTETSLYYLEHESVLVFGGINVHSKYGIGRNTGKDVYRYLPIANNWEYVGEMPAPRTHHCVAFLVGRIYVVGGADPREDDVKGKFVVVDTVWSFEPVRRMWFTEGSLNVRRKNFGLVVFGKYMYAIGGQDKNSRVIDIVERYNPSIGMWEFVAPLRHPRMGVACTKFEEKIWVGGGMCGSTQKPLTDSVECYNIQTDQWTEITRLRVPRCFASFFAMSDNLYLIAGAGRNRNAAHNTISFSSIDIWNKDDQLWEEHAEMEVARHGHTTAYLGTQILIVGGVTTVYMRSLSSIECFCTTRGTWIKGMSTLPNSLSGHATVTLPPALMM